MEKRKKGKKVWIIVIIAAVIILLIIGLVSCMRGISSTMNMAVTGMETVQAERRDLYEDISVSGSVESENIVQVTSMLTAKIETLNVEIGSQVKKGDVLCVFESTDLQAEYDSLLASIQKANDMTENTHKINLRNLENAKTDRDAVLNQAQQAINDAISTRDRITQKYNSLVDKCSTLAAERDDLAFQASNAPDPETQAALSEQYQQKVLELQSAESMRDTYEEQLPSCESAIRTAQDAYNSAKRSADSAVQSYQDVLDAEQFSENPDTQKQLDKLKSQIDACTVKAPASGIITSLSVAQGSIPKTDALMTIEDADKLKITVKVNESDILKLHEGMTATVRTTATGDTEFPATVTRVVNIFSGSEETGGGYSAEISIEKTNSQLLIGMSAKAKIILSEKKDVLSVPYESVTEDADGNTIVFIVQEDENGLRTAHAVPVTVGMETSYYVEISGGELKEGDEVIMTAKNVSEGDIIPESGFTQMQDGEKNA